MYIIYTVPLVVPIHLTVVVARPPRILTSKSANRGCGEGRVGVKVSGREVASEGAMVLGDSEQEKMAREGRE